MSRKTSRQKYLDKTIKLDLKFRNILSQDNTNYGRVTSSENGRHSIFFMHATVGAYKLLRRIDLVYKCCPISSKNYLRNKILPTGVRFQFLSITVNLINICASVIWINSYLLIAFIRSVQKLFLVKRIYSSLYCV